MGDKLKVLLEEACSLSHSTDTYNAERKPAKGTLRKNHSGSMLGVKGIAQMSNMFQKISSESLKELIKEYEDVFDVADVLVGCQ